ncbi:hypothetical protein BCD64_23715 [Nostoc sp. MBR 210]|nr:hypothetical protein BCD64_23715 [Nostoc sp. MBR 210]
MKIKHDEWKVLQLFTATVVATVMSSALSNFALVNAVTISESTIEERLAKVREHIKQTGETLNHTSETLLSQTDNHDTPAKNSRCKLNSQLSQWGKWAKV